MCGIFGVIPVKGDIDRGDFKALSSAARQRGRDSSGLLLKNEGNINLEVYRDDKGITRLRSKVMKYDAELVCGHSRLTTSGETDNQPVVGGDIFVLHNGIILNTDKV